MTHAHRGAGIQTEQRRRRIREEFIRKTISSLHIKMATLTDLKDLVDLALGTPETVNFKALQELLLGIISHLTTLYKKFREKSSEDANFQTEFVKPSALRRKSYAGSFVLPPTSSPAPFSSPTDDQGETERDDYWAYLITADDTAGYMTVVCTSDQSTLMSTLTLICQILLAWTE